MHEGLDQVYARMADHLRNGTTDMAEAMLHVPVSNFTCPDHLQRELAVFRGQPLVAAMASELAEPGSFVTRDLLGTPLLIVRQKDGSVAAYRNRCRHRGGKVEQVESGKKPFFVCAYHGWSYGADGSLRGVPFDDHLGGIDKACNGLFALPCEERHGMVWVSLSEGGGINIADYLGAADSRLASYAIANTTLFMEKRIDLAINWKLVMDGAIDVLHPQFLHPSGVGKRIETSASVWEDFGRHGRSWSAYKKLSDKIKAGTDRPEDRRYITGNLQVFPNASVIPTPTHIEYWNVWPHLTDPARCHIHIRFLVQAHELDEERAAKINKSWEILNQAATEEAFPMEQTIQANANSWPQGDFLYGRGEAPCQHLHRQLAKAMAQ
jgi:phenylpropionate dioxygenase-like ring-hydroxylating dioxygenase large terminal subunit